MLVASALAGLAMASTASAAIVITYPTADATWFTNTSARINFTAGEGDPTHWTVILTNEDSTLLSGPQQILQQLNQTNGFVDIRLPHMNEGDGYKVIFANETNTTDVFAETESFRIEHGILPNTSSTSATASKTSTAIGLASKASGESKTSSGNPFETPSAKADTAGSANSAAGQLVPAALSAGAVAAAVFALL